MCFTFSMTFCIFIYLNMHQLFYYRKYYRLLKKMNSLQYTSITRTSPRPENNTNSCQQYEELGLSENGYHNMELINWNYHQQHQTFKKIRNIFVIGWNQFFWTKLCLSLCVEINLETRFWLALNNIFRFRVLQWYINRGMFEP